MQQLKDDGFDGTAQLLDLNYEYIMYAIITYLPQETFPMGINLQICEKNKPMFSSVIYYPESRL